MARRQLKKYVILFQNEWQIPEPVFYWIGEVKGQNPKDALKRNLARLLRIVRKTLELDKTEGADYKLERNLYVIPAEHWMSANTVYWNASLADTSEIMEML